MRLLEEAQFSIPILCRSFPCTAGQRISPESFVIACGLGTVEHTCYVTVLLPDIVAERCFHPPKPVQADHFRHCRQAPKLLPVRVRSPGVQMHSSADFVTCLSTAK